LSNDKITEWREKDDEDISCSGSEGWDDDQKGIGEWGFSHFTRFLPVIYLRQGLNEKPDHTNFCSKQIPPAPQLGRLTGIAVGTMQTPALTVQVSSKKKTSKAKSKDVLVKLVTELKDRRGKSL
jgi:hypothetical protein